MDFRTQRDFILRGFHGNRTTVDVRRGTISAPSILLGESLCGGGDAPVECFLHRIKRTRSRSSSMSRIHRAGSAKENRRVGKMLMAGSLSLRLAADWPAPITDTCVFRAAWVYRSPPNTKITAGPRLHCAWICTPARRASLAGSSGLR